MQSSTLVQNSTEFRSFDGTRLTGILTIPTNVQAAALILPGSGNVAADGDVSSPFVGHGYRGAKAKLSEDLAQVLAKNGVASFRYSKRGVEDASQLPNQTFPFLISDAVAALEYLQRQVPATKRVIVGFSEGAIVAVQSAARTPVDGLFLFGMPSRDLDETFQYQFIEWPLECAQKLDQDRDGILTAKDFTIDGEAIRLPLLGADLSGMGWQELTQNKKDLLSIEKDIRPLYEEGFKNVQALLQTDMFRDWYQSSKALPSFSHTAGKVKCPVYLYHAKEDAQTRSEWMEDDFRFFPTPAKIEVFNELGHCFAPMEGAIGEVKTSGPFADSVMARFAQDVKEFCARQN